MHPGECDWMVHCDFDSHFPNNRWGWVFSHVLYYPFMYLLWRNACPNPFPTFKMWFYLFFWLCWVLLLRGLLSSFGEQELLVVVHAFLVAEVSLVVERGLQGVWAQELWLPGPRLWHTGLVAPWPVGSSQANVSCTGRQIHYHGAAREASFAHSLNFLFITIFCIRITC